jgi:hypothetical protein
MMNAQIGMRVEVSLVGLTVGGLPCGQGTITPATITAVDPSTQTVTVQLDAPFNGQSEVQLDGTRVNPR